MKHLTSKILDTHSCVQYTDRLCVLRVVHEFLPTVTAGRMAELYESIPAKGRYIRESSEGSHAGQKEVNFVDICSNVVQ